MNILAQESPSTNQLAVTTGPPGLSTAGGRPRLLAGLPVLRRAPGETQIGVDPRHAVVISGVPDPLAPLLHTLDGRHTTEELMARAGPEHHEALRQILTGLAEMGLLDDHPPPDQPQLPRLARLSADRTNWALRAGPRAEPVDRCRRDAAVVVHGDGRVAVAVATLLAASGVGWVQTVAEGVVAPEDPGCGYLNTDIGEPRAEAAARAIRRASSDTGTGRLPAHRRPDLVILTDVVVPEPRVVAGLTAEAIPHLLARAAEGTGMVGPLVVPGRSCCLRCVDLHSTDADGDWPVIAAQLAARSQPADLASAHAVAAFTVGQALRLLHGPPPSSAELPTWGAAIEIDVFGASCRKMAWNPHPRCPCGVAPRQTEATNGVATIT